MTALFLVTSYKDFPKTSHHEISEWLLLQYKYILSQRDLVCVKETRNAYRVLARKNKGK
jgi:hypothetical protein